MYKYGFQSFLVRKAAPMREWKPTLFSFPPGLLANRRQLCWQEDVAPTLW